MNYTKYESGNIEFYHIENDAHSQARYVFHYQVLSDNYNEALNLSRSVGGKKYRASWYGGGIVISTSDIDRTARKINNIINKELLAKLGL